jgi:2-polyprenyl-6-methoxyphenol hydroxylase-like FAD-dependent oxidoreductase
MSGEYDVAMVGASTAGCTAARLFSLRGARVALIERRPARDAYKTVCTHYIQSSATPTIEKLGLARRYRRVHRRRLVPHYMVISDIASGRPVNPIERRLYRAAARDEVVRHGFEQVGSRRRSPACMLDPRLLTRVARHGGAGEAPARPSASGNDGAPA